MAAVFTRRSVKEAQQEGIRRTTRELTNAFLTAVGPQARRPSGGGDTAVRSAAALIALARHGRGSRPRRHRGRSRASSRLRHRPRHGARIGGHASTCPSGPTTSSTLGDVSNPGALQFIAGKSVIDYIGETGGTSKSADKRRIFLVLPNGTAEPLRDLKAINAKVVVPPGSTIVVPKDIDPLFTLDLIRDVAGIFGGLCISSIATVGILATNR